MKKYIVFPDLHGQITLFKKALKHIKEHYLSKNSYHLVFLGDYIDRGEAGEVQDKPYKDAGSLQVILKLLELEHYCQANGIEITFLKGNHEECFAYNEDQISQDMPSIPLDEYTHHCFERNGMTSELLRFIKRCELHLLDKKAGYLFVHAGIDPHKSNPLHSSEQTMLWIREPFIEYNKRYPYTVVFGHTPFQQILNKPDRIGLDGGVFIRDEQGYGKLNVAILSKSGRKFISFTL